MSPLWLILIVPTVFMGGYILCGIISNADQEDRCRKCIMSKKDKEV